MKSVKFQGALVKLSNDSPVLIVLIGQKIFHSEGRANDLMKLYSRAYPGTPVLLATLDGKGRTIYRAFMQHKDIVLAMKDVPVSSLPIQEHTVFIEEEA